MDGVQAQNEAGGEGLGEGTAGAAPGQCAIWIASYPKSGNTWVRVFLHNLLRELHEPDAEAQDINALHEVTARESLAARFTRHLGKPAREATITEIAEKRTRVQADMVRGKSAPVYIKTHNAIANVDGFPAINFAITLAAIYIVRNPLDVAVSYAHFAGMSYDEIIGYMVDPGGNIEASERNVHEFISSWRHHAASWMSIAERPVLLLRFEDMLMAPERSFGRLASFLRLKPSPDQLGRAIEKSSFAEMVRQEERNGFNERPQTSTKFFRSGCVGQWKDVLTPSQVSAVHAAQGPMMMRFGYLAENCGSVGA